MFCICGLTRFWLLLYHHTALAQISPPTSSGTIHRLLVGEQVYAIAEEKAQFDAGGIGPVLDRRYSQVVGGQNNAVTEALDQPLAQALASASISSPPPAAAPV